MTREQAVLRVQEGLGFRTDMQDVIIRRLQEEQRDLELGKTLPRFLHQGALPLNLLAGENDVYLPIDFLRRSDRPLTYPSPEDSEASRIIPWRDYNQAFSAYNGYDRGGPAVAAIKDIYYVSFFPRADADYSISWTYYIRDPILDSDFENNWLANAPELLIGGAGLRIARDLRNQEAQKLFSEMYKQARMTWFSETIVEAHEDLNFLGGNA